MCPIVHLATFLGTESRYTNESHVNFGTSRKLLLSVIYLCPEQPIFCLFQILGAWGGEDRIPSVSCDHIISDGDLEMCSDAGPIIMSYEC